MSRKAKRRKLAKEEDAKLNDDSAIKAAIRVAKRGQRPTKVGEPEPRTYRKEQQKAKNARKRKATKVGKGTGFGREADEVPKRSREGTRARRGDAMGGVKHKGRQTNR